MFTWTAGMIKRGGAEGGVMTVATHLDIVVFQRSATGMDIVFARFPPTVVSREITRAASAVIVTYEQAHPSVRQNDFLRVEKL